MSARDDLIEVPPALLSRVPFRDQESVSDSWSVIVDWVAEWIERDSIAGGLGVAEQWRAEMGGEGA